MGCTVYWLAMYRSPCVVEAEKGARIRDIEPESNGAEQRAVMRYLFGMHRRGMEPAHHYLGPSFSLQDGVPFTACELHFCEDS